MSPLLLPLLLACSAPAPDSAGGARAVEGVELTWLGVTTWLLRTGEHRILLDPYLTRGAPGAVASGPAATGLLDTVLAAEGIEGLDQVLVGHSHFDHAWDAGTSALHTGAALAGTATTCHIGAAQGLPAARCRALTDGETLAQGEVRVEAVRVSHWGPDLPNGRHGTWDAPPDDPADAGLAPHGGVLGYLIEADGQRIFFQDTLGPADADDGSGFDFGAPLARLAAGPPVDLWVGAVSLAADADTLPPYLEALRPRAVLAHHWDGVVPDPTAGLTRGFSAPTHVGDALAAAGVPLLAPAAYGARIVSDGHGPRPAADSPVAAALAP